MASRFENRRYGRRGRHENFEGRERYEEGRRSMYPRSEGRDLNRDEGYFGGGRQSFGEGYTGPSPSRRGGRWSGDFEEGGSGESYYGGGPNTDFGSEFTTGRPDEGYGSRRDLSGEGMYGGGFGGYSGGGYQGWDPGMSNYGGANYGGGRYGRSNESEGRYGNRYRSDYPSSERGYFDRTSGQNYGPDDRGWLERAGDEVASWFGDEEAERRRERDARMHGQYRGRGPRNYTRSDDRIREDINDDLTDHDFLDASEIDVQVSAGEVILTGTVGSRYEKRMAEDVAERVSGVKNVENRIRVAQHEWSSTSTSGSFAGGSSQTGSSTGLTGTTESGSTTRGRGKAAGSTE